MKKTIALITAVILALSLSACGNGQTAPAGAATSSVTGASNEAFSEVQSVEPTHQHSYTAVKTAGTCQKKGYTTYTCRCGDSYVDDYVSGKHEYVNNRCKYCGKADIDGLYANLKAWVLKNGTVCGDYVSFSKTADTYGGYENEYFSLYYWNDTEKLEFSLHCPLNDTYSHNFYIYIPKKYTGNYEYVSSYYYRDTGVSKYESVGYVEAAVFTKSYPLKSTSYYGAADRQSSFLEESRVGVCDALVCLDGFLRSNNIGYTLKDLGFTSF